MTKEEPTIPVIVYVSGPYTKPDPASNVVSAIRVADTLSGVSRKVGFITVKLYPFIPHLSHFWGNLFPKPYDYWLEIDRVFISRSDCLLVIPGESKGVGIEIEDSSQKGIPIFLLPPEYSKDDILEKGNQIVDSFCDLSRFGSRVGRKR